MNINDVLTIIPIFSCVHTVYMAEPIFHTNIEQVTLTNTNYRKVLFTGKHMQLVVMSLLPKEEIDLEVHPNVDQFIRVERGTGQAVINEHDSKKVYELKDGISIIVPALTWHRIVNTSSTEELKLYTIYSPPEHKPGTIQQTKPTSGGMYHLYQKMKSAYESLVH